MGLGMRMKTEDDFRASFHRTKEWKEYLVLSHNHILPHDAKCWKDDNDIWHWENKGQTYRYNGVSVMVEK
jgi:hypothetical protein